MSQNASPTSAWTSTGTPSRGGSSTPRSDPLVERIFHEEASVRRLIARFPDPTVLTACYEAGRPATTSPACCAPSGVRSDVVAPSLVPNDTARRVGHTIRGRQASQTLARRSRASTALLSFTAIRLFAVGRRASAETRDRCSGSYS